MSKMYYHVTNWPIDSFCVGQEYSTPIDSSLYWRSRLDGAHVEKQDILSDILGIPREALDKASDELNQMNINGVNLKDLLFSFRSLSSNLAYSSQLLKEYIFEDIRASEFPNLPSRKRCMFLFDGKQDKEEAKVLSAKMFGASYLSGRSLINIEVVNGKSIIHRTDATLLDVNVRKQPEIVEAARKYWTGTNESIERHEVILEGSYIICEIIETY